MGPDASEQHTQGRALQAWHLALLRFAVTLEVSDRQAGRAIAAELDRSGCRDRHSPSFAFFRKYTEELCNAIVRPDHSGETMIRRHLSRMADGRLKRAFQAAVELTPPVVIESRSVERRRRDLWRGLEPRRKRLAIERARIEARGPQVTIGRNDPADAFPATSVRAHACNGPRADSAGAYRHLR
jgi:hypothetical protein